MAHPSPPSGEPFAGYRELTRRYGSAFACRTEAQAPVGITESPALRGAFASKRLMGFEPTTFCMASSWFVRGPDLKCLQMGSFTSSPNT